MIFKVASALRSLCSYFAARCIGHGNVVKVKEDGVMDILRVLLHSRDYGLMRSSSRVLVTLLYWF